MEKITQRNGRRKSMTENHYFCMGCGATIQTENHEEIGYTPTSVLTKMLEKEEPVYCQRCFRLRNYNELQPASLSDDDFLKMLSSIAEEDALVVYVVDLFDLYGSMISGLKRFIGNNPVLFVANKVDLYPKSVNRNRLKNWIERFAKEYGIRPVDTILVSANKRIQIDELLDKINEYRQGKDAYVVGVTNVGKSTLINKLIQSIGGTKDVITTSQFPGTTLGQIDIPFDEESSLIDTPGIIHRHQIAHYLAEKEVKKVLPQKELQPKTFQLNAEQTIFIGGLVRVDYTKGERNSLTFYTPQTIELHRTKLEKADDFYARHNGTILTPPTGDNVKQYPALQKIVFSVKEKSDIVIAGLGWVTIQKPGTIEVWSPKEVDVIKRPSII